MIRSLRLLAPLALLATALPLSAQEAAGPGDADIVAVAQEAGSFSTLLAAAEAAGLVDTLRSEGPFTVFAPTDEAFAALPEGTVESLLEDLEALRAVLLYHVVPGRIASGEVVQLDEATTAEGSTLRISLHGELVHVDDAQVVAVDVEASNGLIHVIDSVLLPASLTR